MTEHKELCELLEIPEDDIIVVVHIKKEGMRKLIGALELAGITNHDVKAMTEKGIYNFEN